MSSKIKAKLKIGQGKTINNYRLATLENDYQQEVLT